MIENIQRHIEEWLFVASRAITPRELRLHLLTCLAMSIAWLLLWMETAIVASWIHPELSLGELLLFAGTVMLFVISLALRMALPTLYDD